MNQISSGRGSFLAGVSALALGAMLTLGSVATAPGARANSAGPMTSYADIVAADKPAVVTVTVEMARPAAATSDPSGAMPPEEFFRHFFGENSPLPGMPMPPQGPDQGGPQAQGGTALGSGFIIAEDGTVVTNNHVVENGVKISVTLDDGTELPATLVGTDAKNDIAVLKVEAKGKLPTVEWGNSDALRLGDPVVAIGDPFGIGTTVTSGIVSARGRDLHNGPYDDFIQVDAAINHGNSGGPLVDASGKVVGINTAIYSPNGGNVGVGFAIPSAQAEEVVEKILANGTIEHGFIGVQIQPVDKDVAEALGLKDESGALVASVQPGSPAEEAGIRAGDVILTANGQATADPKALARAIADLVPGDKAKIELWRTSKVETLDLTVGKLPGTETAAAGTGAPEPSSLADLGLDVQTLTDQDARTLGLDPGTGGVVITDVSPDGKAASEGLAPGDVIVSVNQEPVASVEDLTKALDAAKSSDRTAALLLVERHGQPSFVAVPVG